jgi:dsRNA-specific ribonuclease
LVLNGKKVAVGKGKSKKAAENEAAKKISTIYLVQ